MNFEFRAERDNFSVEVTIMGGLTRKLNIDEAEKLCDQMREALNELRYAIEKIEDAEDEVPNRGWSE